MNSVLKGVLSRGGADLLQLAMGIAGSVFSVTIFLMPVLAFAQGHAIVMPGQLVVQWFEKFGTCQTGMPFCSRPQKAA